MKIRSHIAASATVALFGALTACGGGNADTASQAAPQPATESSSADNPDTGPSAGSSAAGAATITMRDIAYTPTKVTAKPGATVKIVNKDTTVHDVVDAKDGIKSGDVKANGTGTVKAPSKAGSYPFICTYHPNMKGTLVVA